MRVFLPRSLRRLMPAAWALPILVFASVAGRTQTLHEDFVRGAGAASAAVHAPSGWTLEGGSGRWESAGPGRGRSLSVTGSGDDMSFWRRVVPGLKAGQSYRVRFQARVAHGSATGTVISGLNLCNRDFSVTEDWQPYTFVFKTPLNIAGAFLRFGQWHLKGTVYIGDVSLSQVIPIDRTVSGLRLGTGEWLDNGTYSFGAMLSLERSNAVAPLVDFTAPFNSDRWIFSDGNEVVYRYALKGRVQSAGSISCELVNYSGGECVVLVSADGKPYIEVGRVSGNGTHPIKLPASLYPARVVQVRLCGEAGSGKGGAPTGFAVNRYMYTGVVADGGGLPSRAEGSSKYLEILTTDPRLTVRVEDLGDPARADARSCRLTLRPGHGLTGAVVASLRFISEETGNEKTFSTTVTLRPSGDTPVSIPFTPSSTGRVRVVVSVHPASAASRLNLFAAQAEGYVPTSLAEDYGYRLPAIPEGQLWWCESTYKINPLRRPPTGAAAPIGSVMPAPGRGLHLSAARRERGSVQLVLRPGARVGTFAVAATDLIGPRGARIPRSAIQIRRVAFVNVRVPTDGIGSVGEWPDPLPPLDGVWTPRPGTNNPLWITITVPADAPAGDYRGSIVLQNRNRRDVPLSLHVWNFEIPAKTSLRSGFGINPGNIGRYSNLSSDAQTAKVWDLYMRDFAAHRICPYNPMTLAPIRMDVEKGATPKLKLDFADFDREAHRYLDELGFNSFVISFPGLGGGRYPTYDEGSFFGYVSGTPEYEALMSDYGHRVEDHLAEHGWLDKAYVYWYDEPGTADYPFVNRGMEKLHRFAPRLKRMMTEGFRPALFGGVDLWCPITPKFSAEPSAARQALGEEVWWYVCTGPKEPFVGLFIDHPADELRMWLWQTWKYHVQGILIWETTWWTSPRFGEKVQNPWTDPMSYTDEAGGVWGNGDGRFFYPPDRDPLDRTGAPVLSEPIDSLRWEMLGEGINDWEYFHLLEHLARADKMRGIEPALVARAQRLLAIPNSICRDMTHFTADPQPLYRRREEVARTIEAFKRTW